MWNISFTREADVLLFCQNKKENQWGRRFKNVSRKDEVGNKIEKNVAKVVDVGTLHEAVAIFYERSKFFLQSTHPFPALSSATTLQFLVWSCLPHAIGSSRFGGHCTATGGCGGVIGGGESIFHDDVVSLVGKCFLVYPLCFSARCVYRRVPRDTWLQYFPLLDRRKHPLQDASRSIFHRSLYIYASNFHSLSCTL